MIKSLPVFLVKKFFILYFIFGCCIAGAQSVIDAQFLQSSANADGSISSPNDLTWPYQSTAEALITLDLLGQSSATIATDGRAYLESISVDSTENLALRPLSSSPASPSFDTTLAAINQRQNFDGGFGAFVGFGSDLISTTYALRVLSRTSTVNEVSGSTVSYLLAQQNADGSWSLQDNPNRVETTALVVNTLWLYRRVYQLDTALNNGIAYLVSQRRGDNLWYSVEASALALLAILNVEIDRSPYQASLTDFADLQNSNGSFGDDVYLTALGLRVLDAIARSAPDEIVVSGQVVDGDTGLPLAGVQIDLTGPETLNQPTDSNGTFRFQGVQPGNYVLSLSLSGYSTLTTDTLLRVGDNRDFGTLTLLKSVGSPTTGTIIGTVIDATDGSALAGVMITATGNSQPGITNAEGQFQLNNILPGSVSIQAALPGYATVTGNADISAGQTLVFSPSLTLLAEAQVIVGGTITDQDTGQALEGVVVTVQGGGNNVEAITDAFGQYEIAGLQAGDLILSAALSGYQTASGNITAPLNIRINFSPALLLEGVTPEPVANSGIIGRVVDGISGVPLPGASILLSTNSDNQSLVSESDGTFSFSDLSSGSAQLSISLSGYQTLSTTIELPENVILNVGDVSLLPEGVQETSGVRGIVVDSSTNQPLAGVVVDGQFASGNVSLTTDANGAFEFFDLVDTKGVLIFGFDGYNTVNFRLSLTPNGTLELGQIRMRPEEVIELIPDLEIESLSAASVGTDLQTLEVFGAIDVDVRNQGNVEVSISTNALAFYDVDADNAFDASVDQVLGQVALPETIAIDESISVGIFVSGNLPFRDAPIHVWVDSDRTLVEADEDNNITSTADQCQPFKCPVGTADSRAFEPVVKWEWTGSEIEPLYFPVYTTPLVAQTNDDNNDGVVNQNDIPDVIFSATNSTGGLIGNTRRGIIRIVSGADGSDLAAFSNVRDIGAYGNLAVGDIDNDKEIEILAPGLSGLYAFERDGTQKWYQPYVGSIGWGSITIADLNADGVTEIIAAGTVLDNNGNILWNSPVQGGLPNGGIPVAADINLDGQQEVIFGGTVFDANGNLVWQNSITPDGFAAIGNFDQDEQPEVVVVYNGRVSLLDNDGNLLWRVTIPDILIGVTGGPPTVADLDGDGEVEIGVAARTLYTVFNADGSVLWQAPITDQSSRTTGSSAFDFDNDGDVEVVYADESTLYVFDGATGEVVFDMPHFSNTVYEYPVIVDIDNDGHAEIVVAQNRSGINGIKVLEDINDAWVDTRSIWNQHAYNIDNVNEDGTIPAVPAKSWLTHNTFRLNTFPECKLETNAFDPVIEWNKSSFSVASSSDQVMMTPAVADLNQDGIPDIVFSTFTPGAGFPSNSILRAISGDDGSEIWNIIDTAFQVRGTSSIAIGDIDLDGLPEIIAVHESDVPMLVEHDGSVTRIGTNHGSINWGGAAIADLDQDGVSEIIIGDAVLNNDLTLRWKGNGSKRGDNGAGPLSLVADLNLDGFPEVLVGSKAYHYDGTLFWDNTRLPDGFSALGNFDEDPFPEIALVSSGLVYLLEYTGAVVWGPVAIPGGGGGGAPTIADFDGDGEVEIAVAGSTRYCVYETDGSLKWSSVTQDNTSSRTGSSVFDFDGDGAAEVIYGDELFLRIYRGSDGAVLYELEKGSGTTYEMPIVVDVDADGAAEIVAIANDYNFGNVKGILSIGNANDTWVPTRKIWNQHTYHINNVNEDGTVPLQEEPSWLSHNTYRLNTFADRNINVLALSDLTVSKLSVTDQGISQSLSLNARIGNGGGMRSLNTKVHFYDGSPTEGGTLIAEQSFQVIDPGQWVDISIDNVTGISSGDEIFAVVDPDNKIDECREDNNGMSILASGILGEITLSLNGTIFGSNTDIDLATQVTNTGSLEASYTVALSILDAAGAEVASVAAFDVTVLAPAESLNFNDLWNTGTTISGDYTAQAILSDVDGNSIDTAEANFSISDLIGGTPAAALRATTDRPVYHVDDQVQLDALAENITTIHPITDPQLQLMVMDVTSAELFNETVALVSLAPGQIAEATRSLELTQANEGMYQYQATLTGNGGTTFATASANFEVVNDLNVAIQGTVAVEVPEVTQGELQTCTFTTTNTGTQNLSALAVNYRVVNVDTQTTVMNESALLNLSAGESEVQLQSFSTNAFVSGNYACVLEAEVNGLFNVLDSDSFTVVASSLSLIGELQVVSSPRILVLVDPIPETCTANRSVTLEGEFDRRIRKKTKIYAEVFEKYKKHYRSRDCEHAKPYDFQGDMPIEAINHNDGRPDIAITALSEERIQIKISDTNALKGEYWLTSYNKYLQLNSGLINFECSMPLSIGDSVGDFTVVDTENVELMETAKYKHSHHKQHGNKYHKEREQEDEVPDLETQYEVLESLLADRAYILVDTNDAFKTELLSGQYQQYLLLSGFQNLDKSTATKLREAVYCGEGLVFAGGHTPKYKALWETLGLKESKYKGKGKGKNRYDYKKYDQLQAEGVRLLESPIAFAEDVTFGLNRTLPFIDLDQANIAGNFLNPETEASSKDCYDKSKGKKSKINGKYKKGKGKKGKDKYDDQYCSPVPKNEPAVTYTDYGKGNAVFVGYDLLAEATHLGLEAAVNPHADLLINSLNYTEPEALELHPESVVPVQLSLQNLGGETSVTATMQWPWGSQLIDSVPLTNYEDETAIWMANLDAGQTSLFTSWAIPKYSDGTAMVSAEIYLGEDTTQAPYQVLELSLQATQAESLESIIGGLILLIESEADYYERKQLEKVLYLLEKAAYYRDKGKHEKALDRLLDATDYLKKVESPEAAELRLRVDELLLQWGTCSSK